MEIMIKSPQAKYRLTINRKVTILQGDSGSGKTLLCEALVKYGKKSESVTVNVSNGFTAMNLTAETYLMADLLNKKNFVFFIDEGYDFVYQKSFDRIVRDSRNYFVIVSRNNIQLQGLPYSIDEIYTLKNIAGFIRNVKKYDIPENRLLGSKEPVTAFVSEDSKSSYFMLCRLAKVKSTKWNGGNSTVLSRLTDLVTENCRVLVMVDAAAFGAFIDDIWKQYNLFSDKIAVYLPESFEWLLLHLYMFNDDDYVQDSLRNPDTLSASYEQFYTDVCIEAFRRHNISYSKHTDSDDVYTATNLKQLSSYIPPISIQKAQIDVIDLCRKNGDVLSKAMEKFNENNKTMAAYYLSTKGPFYSKQEVIDFLNTEV